MTNFIKTITGAWISISAVEIAEPHDAGQLQLTTARGRYIVSESAFNEAAGISPVTKKSKVTKS